MGIVGFCHNPKHKGHLTHDMLKGHKCLSNQCIYLEKYTDSKFFIKRRRVSINKTLRKQINNILTENIDLPPKEVKEWEYILSNYNDNIIDATKNKRITQSIRDYIQQAHDYIENNKK